MGSTTFILFDNGVEKIIPKTAKELAEMQDEVIMNSKFLIKSIHHIVSSYNFIFYLYRI